MKVIDFENPHAIEFGKACYDAYCEQTGGVSLISGAVLPPFEEMREDIRRGWIAAARMIENLTEDSCLE